MKLYRNYYRFSCFVYSGNWSSAVKGKVSVSEYSMTVSEHSAVVDHICTNIRQHVAVI